MQERMHNLADMMQYPKDALDRYPAELSGGQRQRVSLMRAMMLDPEFLLLDEPLGALDPMIRFGLQSELKELFSKLNKTVIMVTHDMDEAAYLADRIVLMKDGAVVQDGTYEELEKNPADPFVNDFLQAQQSRLPQGGK